MNFASLESQCFLDFVSGKHWDSRETQFTVPLGTSHQVFIVRLCLNVNYSYTMHVMLHLGISKFVPQNTDKISTLSVIFAAASEPEANKRGSSLISRRLHYRGLQSLFLTKRKELWLCANWRVRMRSGMRKELWLCANGNIFGCAVIWRKILWLCANGWF